MNVTLIVILSAFVILFSTMILMGKRKARWYKVHMANPEDSELDVYRTLMDRWWALDAGAFVTFRRRNGQKVRLSKHWIIKIESESDAHN